MAMRGFSGRLAIPLLLAPLLAGCVVGQAVSLTTGTLRAGVTAINTTGDVYDRLSVSDSEKDQRRGREIRRREERMGQIDRDYAKLRKKCDRGDDRACEAAGRLRYERAELMPRVPYEPD